MPILNDILERLRVNVETGLPDQTDQPMKVPASTYADVAQFQREIDEIFLGVPLLVALACEVPEPGDYVAFDLVGRPLLIVRGDDGVVRTLLNVCRHRGAKVTSETCGSARRFTCPYHSWNYDTVGSLVGVPGRDSFGEVDATGLVELPTVVRAGAVFAMLDPDGSIDIDAWLGGLDTSLEALRLDEFHPYRVPTYIDSPNWKLAADGYLDGYHIGYLHRNTIGTRSITNRNTYDFFGPHVRIGFAGKPILDYDPTVPSNLPDYMSLVHYVFPNISISGGHGDTLMMSRLLPGPAPDRSRTLQFQFYRQPIEGEMVDIAEQKRLTYESVVRDEDCATIFDINAALPAMGDRHFVFGRNEPANQHLHRTIAEMTRH
jgi:phenylpropionate dioxygenase-like ring-hydroxylating dioxygenase large terminal subunit